MQGGGGTAASERDSSPANQFCCAERIIHGRAGAERGSERAEWTSASERVVIRSLRIPEVKINTLGGKITVCTDSVDIVICTLIYISYFYNFVF